MKKYYLIGSIVAVVIFILTFSVLCIMMVVHTNNQKKQTENLQNDIVIVRYFTDDDYDSAEVVYIQVTDKNNYKIYDLPQKEGYFFSGLYDGPDYNLSTLYVDSNGNGIVPLTSEILLYPIFVKGE